MAITGADLIEPAGALTPALFPELSSAEFTARVNAYAADGNTQALAAGFTGSDADGPAASWAYYRAYTAIFLTLNRDPASASLSDQGSASYFVTQIQLFKDMADASLAEFRAAAAALVADVAPTADTYPTIRSLRRAT